jgi:hypothetical protein
MFRGSAAPGQSLPIAVAASAQEQSRLTGFCSLPEPYRAAGVVSDWEIRANRGLWNAEQLARIAEYEAVVSDQCSVLSVQSLACWLKAAD